MVDLVPREVELSSISSFLKFSFWQWGMIELLEIYYLLKRNSTISERFLKCGRARIMFKRNETNKDQSSTHKSKTSKILIKFG